MEKATIEKLLSLPHSDIIRHINYYQIPTYITGISEEGARLFNEIYDFVKEYCKDRKLIRTQSGGISSSSRYPAYDIRWKRSSVELTFVSRYGCYRIQFRSELESDGLSGRKAFNKFRKLAEREGINLEDYAVNEEVALFYKSKIPKPLIALVKKEYKDQIFNNVHHIDFHSSYPAGLINTHPEFETLIKRIYNRRRVDESCKAILNYTIGFFQSIECCKARWSPLSRDAIEDNNTRLLNIAMKLLDDGRKPILFNTDGLWYQGEIYHGEGEGDDIGQWHNDHINCQFRAKSDGAYEFIENGIYYPVVRGVSNESKEDWKWGNIYIKGESSIYSYEDGKGILKDGEKI